MGLGFTVNLFTGHILPLIKKDNETIRRLHEDVGSAAISAAYFFFAFVWTCSYMFYFDRSHMIILDYHVRSTLAMMPKDSLIFGMDKRMGFSIPFLQLTERIRPDVDYVHNDLFIHNHWKKNKKNWLNVKWPLKEYGSTEYDKETNVTRYQHNVDQFIRANQQRNIFLCQDSSDRHLDFLRTTQDFELLPWNHCDQVFVTSNYTTELDMNDPAYFYKRHDFVNDHAYYWGFRPPHLSLLPQHSYEFWINKLMWDEKVRLAKMSLDLGIFYVEQNRLDKGITNIATAGGIYHKEIARAMKVAQTQDPESYVPPHWFKELANVHLRLADYGGRQYFDSFKLARMLMEKFIVQRGRV